MKPPRPILRLPNRPYLVCHNSAIYRVAQRTVCCSYSTSSNPPPPPHAGYALLPSRRLVSLSGPDSTHFLQGAITANLAPSTSRTSGFYAAFLNAQGRLLNDVFIYPENTSGTESWLIEVDAKDAERLARHIKRYKLRAKFNVKLLDEGERNIWSVWRDGDGRTGWTPHSLTTEDVAGEAKFGKGVVCCEDNRAPGMGRRLILPGGKKPEEDLEETTEESYRVRRFLKGVPEGQDELIREAALPQESNIDYMGGIDYRKGCYVGQELTIRTHHTGVVRKRILPVMLYGTNEAMPTTLEYSPEKDLARAIPKETSIGRFEKRGRSAGKYLTGVGNIGLGLCRLEIMTDTMAQEEASGYKEGDEFKLEWQAEGGDVEMVKVKAFVPPWHPAKQ